MSPRRRLRSARRATLHLEHLEERSLLTTLTTGIIKPIGTIGTIQPISPIFTIQPIDPILVIQPIDTLLPVNPAPTGAADEYEVQQNTTLNVASPGVLANDSDAQLDPLAAVLVDQPLHGLLNLRPDGSFVYMPQAGFVGTDTFAYAASDGQALSAPTLVRITITPTPNNAPIAENDTYAVTLNTSVAGAQFTVPGPGVLANDTDLEGDPLAAVLATGPGHGTVTLNANGSFTYRPEQGFSGTDSFTYTARDGRGVSNQATVRITVNTDLFRPVLVNDAFATTTGRTLVVSGLGVLANDALPLVSAPPGDPGLVPATPGLTATVRLLSGPANGVVTFSIDGTFIFNPPPSFVGPIQFTYSVEVSGAPPVSATVQINVLPPPEPPRPDVLDGQVREVASSSSNPDGQPAEPDLILPGPAARPGLSPTLGAFDPADGRWYLRNAVAPGAPDTAPFAYGAAGWVPLLGDWDGNGTLTIGVFDPFTATFYLRNSNDPGAPDFAPFAFGTPGWAPVVGDWDGDGRDTVGVFDPATATFYLRNRNDPGAPDVTPFAFGGSGWRPVVGDWDGDGSTTVGVFDPSGRWYLRNHNSPGVAHAGRFAYGVGNWVPVGGQWQELLGAALLAEEAGAGGEAVSEADLATVADAARARLAAQGADMDALAQIHVGVADLPGRSLGVADGGAVWLDRDAAGHGWFVEPAALDDEKFGGDPGRMDLLTALLHEMSHVLGLDDLDPSAHPDALMAATLAPGTRRTT
jgi:VCBS repeat-containing protein